MPKASSSPLIALRHILPALAVDGKKQALHEIAKLAVPITGLAEHAVFDVLFAREKLGTTGVGHGIAIPHGKLEGLDRVYGFFARLEKPIDFEAIDGKPVDLMFALLAPAEAGADHLKALAKVSRMFRNPGFCDKLRKTDDAKALFALLSASEKETDVAA
ncbi:MAG TPA: PTS IIA-like nitrogen regulatory protein PtsN [Alphaproteobacteria bacterium]|nr:PTS IIA-like nitrogen regulatory protein PtsN [Alphaproteobacteria bacterium]